VTNSNSGLLLGFYPARVLLKRDRRLLAKGRIQPSLQRWRSIIHTRTDSAGRSVTELRFFCCREKMGTKGVLSQREADIQMMLAADVHLGTKNCDFQMERYVYKRRSDGIFIINLGKTWEKLQIAARVIVAIENPQDIIVQSARPYGQRAVLKFAQFTGAHAIAGRHTPGTFTNQLQTSFSEPRLLILTDPRTDHQPIREAALGNIPTIAFCDTDSPMKHVDIGIPANNKGKHSIGCLFWMLARMVLQMRGTIAPGRKWDVMVDLFFYREPEEAKEREEEEVAQAEYVPTFTLGAEQWPTEVADAQWESEAPAVPGIVPPVAGADWMAAPVPDAVGWDMAAAPAIPAAAAAGWDAAMPAVAAGWDAAPVPQQPLAGVGTASWEPAPAAPSSWAPQ